MTKSLIWSFLLACVGFGNLINAAGDQAKYTANAIKTKQVVNELNFGRPPSFGNPGPNDVYTCTGKRYERKSMFGFSSEIVFVESEDICVAACWQYKSEGKVCAAVNYVALANRCQFMRNAYEEGENFATDLSDYSLSNYVEAIKCETSDSGPAPAPAPAPVPLPQPQPQPSPTSGSDSSNTGETGSIRPGSCGQTSVPQKATHSFLTRKGHHRIVGGNMANAHSIPFIVSLRKWNSHYCGGTLIRVSEKVEESDIVITAAHCVSNGRADFDVVLGAHWRSYKQPGEESIAAERVIVHPEYDNPTGSNSHDIAIIKLSRPIKFSQTIQPACMPAHKETVPDGTNGIVAGWGKNRESGGSGTEMLNEVVVPTIPSQKCIESYRYHTIMPQVMLCAGYDQGQKDSCQGDSGGPYFFEGKNGYTLHGVVSWGAGCARASTPGVYARVSTFIDWIRKEVKELSSIKY